MFESWSNDLAYFTSHCLVANDTSVIIVLLYLSNSPPIYSGFSSWNSRHEQVCLIRLPLIGIDTSSIASENIFTHIEISIEKLST